MRQNPELVHRGAKFSKLTVEERQKIVDRDNPDLLISTDESGPLEQESKQRIYQQYRRGESAEALAKKFCRTKTSIYRIVGEIRNASSPS